MSTNIPLVVTISRVFGSGSASLGRSLAARLDIPYLDDEIVQQTAWELKLSHEEMKARDERITPYWKRIVEYSRGAYVGGEYTAYLPSASNQPSDMEILNAEKKVILHVAAKNSAVIVGRAASYILRERPNHLSILVHASEDFRKKRLQEVYNYSEKEAINVIHTMDERRAQHLQTVTGSAWSDARQYHLCLDVGVIGIKESEEVILKALQIRFDASVQDKI